MENTPAQSDKKPAKPPFSNRLMRAVIVTLLTGIIAASGVVTMIGPQIMVVVPAVIVAGIFLAFRRSFWSLVCFGYPLTFGLISAWVGYKEMPGYEASGAFAVSCVVGLLGLGLIAAGLGSIVSGVRIRS